MNFIKETDRFARDLEAWQKGHGFSNQEALRDLAKIWNEFHRIPERQKVIYSGALGNPPDVDPSCGNCGAVRDMLTMVINWRKILEHEVTVEFKGVPPATVVTESEVMTPEVEELKSKGLSYSKTITLDNIDTSEIWGENAGIENGKLDYSGLKMHQIRSLAKEKGIEYTPKTTKEELIKLLSEKG